MSMTHRSTIFGVVGAAVLGGLILSATAGPASAQGVPSEQKIIQALTPPQATRSLAVSPADAARSAEEQKFIDSLRNRQTRSLTVDEKQQIATIAKDKPSVDLEINFDYNSAAINKTSLPGVTTLGKALSNAALKDGTFLVAGHTDARGTDEYNQGLSEKRAEAIKQYLVQKYKIPASNLVAVGYGKTQLKNKDNPEAPENRRVQVVNMAKTSTAAKQ